MLIKSKCRRLVLNTSLDWGRIIRFSWVRSGAFVYYILIYLITLKCFKYLSEYENLEFYLRLLDILFIIYNMYIL